MSEDEDQWTHAWAYAAFRKRGVEFGFNTWPYNKYMHTSLIIKLINHNGEGDHALGVGGSGGLFGSNDFPVYTQGRRGGGGGGGGGAPMGTYMYM